MKKFLLTLMCLLGIATAANAATYELGEATSGKNIFSKEVHSFQKGDITWNEASTFATTTIYYGCDWTSKNDDWRGYQFGKGNAAVSELILSTTGLTGKVTSVVVTTAAGDANKFSVNVSVGSWEGTAQTISATTNDEYTFTPNAEGQVSVKFENTGSSAKALYVRNIVITTEDVLDTPAPLYIAGAAMGWNTGEGAVEMNYDAANKVYTYVFAQGAAAEFTISTYNGGWDAPAGEDSWKTKALTATIEALNAEYTLTNNYANMVIPSHTGDATLIVSLENNTIKVEGTAADPVVTYALHGQFSGDAENWDDVELTEADGGWLNANVTVQALPENATPQFGVKVLTDGNQSGWYASTTADVTVENNEFYDLTNSSPSNFFIEPGKYSISFNPTTSKLYVVKTGEVDTPDVPTEVNYIYSLYSSDFDMLAAPVVAPIDEESAALFEDEMDLVQDGVATFVVAEWPEDAQFFLDRGDVLNSEAPTVELGSGTELAKGVGTILASADFEDYASVLMSLPASANGQTVTLSYVIADNTLTATWEASSEEDPQPSYTTKTAIYKAAEFTGVEGVALVNKDNSTNHSGQTKEAESLEGVEFAGSNSTLTFAHVSNTYPTCFGQSVRMYSGDTFTITPKANEAITSVIMHLYAGSEAAPSGTGFVEVVGEGAPTLGVVEGNGAYVAGETETVTWTSNSTAGVKDAITFETKSKIRFSYLEVITVSDTNGIENVAADANAPVVYYNLQGVRVANPTAGVYVRVQGTKASKVLVK